MGPTLAWPSSPALDRSGRTNRQQQQKGLAGLPPSLFLLRPWPTSERGEPRDAQREGSARPAASSLWLPSSDRSAPGD
ncbi:unnamed protein product, partial [Urochloa humidicola]